jgi:pilus assembly protein CpaF
MFASPEPSPRQVKVLVVDDMRMTADVLAELLTTEGYRVSIAESGHEALDKIASEKPSIVLLDVKMPGMDGFQVCERIKSDPETAFLPVLLVTGLSDIEHRVKGAAAGADDFITKPPDVQELLARVRSLTRGYFLHTALESSYRQVRELLAERTQQLDEAKQELETLLREKMQFTPDLVPSARRGVTTPTRSPLDETSAVTGVGQETIDRQSLRRYKQQLTSGLSETLQGRADLSRTPEMVAELSQRLAAIYGVSGLQLEAPVRQQLFREIVDDIVGYGPIEPLLADPTVTEVMVNGPQRVYVERDGRLAKSGVAFDDSDHVLRVIDRIIRPLGRRVDRKSPMVDARLPDGSRVNAIISPCAIDWPTITVRKFSQDMLTVEDLIGLGSLTPQVAQFLEACVRARLDIILSGGTSSGKTTLLNVLSSYIQEGERIVTIEDSAELQLHQEHVVRLEAKTPEVDGTGGVPIRQLVRNALRMRPDRIIVGEVRGGEALDMLQAMNTGHDGSLTTIHANTPRDSLSRLETLVLMAGMDLPLKAIRSQVASAIDLIIQQARLRDGSRRVTQIVEVQGMEGDVIVLSDIFAFKDEGTDNGRVVGGLSPLGIPPRFSDRLKTVGFDLPPELYVPRSSIPERKKNWMGSR